MAWIISALGIAFLQAVNLGLALSSKNMMAACASLVAVVGWLSVAYLRSEK